MSEIRPSIPGSLTVRTYPEDYGPSDTDTGIETEPESILEGEADDDETQSIETRLLQNQQYIDDQLALPPSHKSHWFVEPQSWKADNGSDVILVRKPTASNLSHRVLNPYIYRNIRNAGTLDNLAALLESPGDWAERYNKVIENGLILQDLSIFRNLPENSPESDIQAAFIGLVKAISILLSFVLTPKLETKIIVGGILAQYQFDVRSQTDPNFVCHSRGIRLIASEAKTHQVFQPGDMW